MLFILIIWIVYLQDGSQYTNTRVTRVAPASNKDKEDEKAKQEQRVRDYECIPCQHGEPMYLKDD